MIGMIVWCALAQTQTVRLTPTMIFAGSRQAPIMPKMVTDWLKPGTAPGWVATSDDTLVYTSVKKVTHVFMPSLRDIVEYKALKFLSSKLEKGTWSIDLKFGELPQFLQDYLASPTSLLDFKSDSKVRLSLDSVANISGMGRRVAMHQNVMTGTRGLPSVLEPVQMKTNSDQTPRPLTPEYQIFSVGMTGASDKQNLIQDALDQFQREITKRKDEVRQPLLEALKGEEPFKYLTAHVGQGLNLHADRASDPYGSSIGYTFGLMRNQLGLSDSQDWQEFSSQAKIDSVSLGVNLEFGQMMNGQAVNAVIRLSP